MQPSLDLDPYTEEIDNNPEAVARQFAAKAKARKGVQLAKDGKVEEAIALFQQAQELQPSIDLNPDTEEIDNNPEAVARELAAENEE